MMGLLLLSLSLASSSLLLLHSSLILFLAVVEMLSASSLERWDSSFDLDDSKDCPSDPLIVFAGYVKKNWLFSTPLE